MKHHFRLFFAVCCMALFSIIVLFTSCSDLMGYSVLLWSIPEQNLYDGDIVPVYIKSNISQVYVIGIPDTEQKIEVPLWQITAPVSKRKITDNAAKYADFNHQYATVAIDGLPMRAESVNTAKQVYRLKKDEVIKVLYKGTGAIPMAGQTPLEGDWLRVLASDGTEGWCFSYNLRLFDEREKKEDDGEQVAVHDTKIERILECYWYPESYISIIKSGAIDLERMKIEYIFDPGKKSSQVRFCNSEINVSYPYDGFTKTKEDTYKFNGTSLTVTYRNANLIVLQYVDGKGIPQSFNMVTISESVSSLVQTEKQRRESLYNQLISAGPMFLSTNYGSLTFFDENTFEWNGFDLLYGDVIPKGAANTGTIEVKYLLDSSLQFIYDGILTFKFDGTSKEINFLYQLEPDGLRLEDASGGTIRSNILMQRSQNPVVLYFAK